MKKYGKLAIVSLVLFCMTYLVVASLFSNSSSLPMAEARWNQAVQQKQVAECNLTEAKLQEWANGKLELTNTDLLRLNTKRTSCRQPELTTPEADKVF
jgi:hypothetical protein